MKKTRTMARILRYKVTFPSNKVFFRENEIAEDMTLFSLNKFLVNDLDFAPDQMIAFRGYGKDGKLKAMWGLFDFGSGTIDGVSLEKTIACGAEKLHYVFDINANKYMELSLIGEVEQIFHVSYPRLVAEKGRIPGQFESKFDTLDNMTPEIGDEIGEDDVDIDDPEDGGGEQ